MPLPQSRTEGLTVRDLPNETLVYDRQRHKALCLNKVAALVWRHCDGQTTVPELAVRLHREMNIPPDERVVRLALRQLSKANLLIEMIDEPAWAARRSRRQLLRALGAMIALPSVMSIAAPKASASTSIRCPSGQIACGGVCVSPLSDSFNCGSCGHNCISGSQKCVNGSCVTACASGFVCKTNQNCPNTPTQLYQCIAGCCVPIT